MWKFIFIYNNRLYNNITNINTVVYKIAKNIIIACHEESSMPGDIQGKIKRNVLPGCWFPRASKLLDEQTTMWGNIELTFHMQRIYIFENCCRHWVMVNEMASWRLHNSSSRGCQFGWSAHSFLKHIVKASPQLTLDFPPVVPYFPLTGGIQCTLLFWNFEIDICFYYQTLNEFNLACHVQRQFEVL